MIQLVLGLAILAAAPAFSSAQAQTDGLMEGMLLNSHAGVETTGSAPEAAMVEPGLVSAPATPIAVQTVPARAKRIGSGRTELDALIARHAEMQGVPLELAHRVVIRESRYNPRAVNSGNYGLMQIRLGTARGLGYRGDAAGLLDPDVNLTYAMKYLAGAYKVAGGNHGRAVSYYASGYYYAAKRQGQTRSANAAQ